MLPELPVTGAAAWINRNPPKIIENFLTISIRFKQTLKLMYIDFNCSPIRFEAAMLMALRVPQAGLAY